MILLIIWKKCILKNGSYKLYSYLRAWREVYKSLVLTKFIASRRILFHIHRCDFYEFMIDDRVGYTAGNDRRDFSKHHTCVYSRGNFGSFFHDN